MKYVCVCIYGVHTYTHIHVFYILLCVYTGIRAGLNAQYKGGSVLPSGRFNALCVLPLKAPLLVWRFY